MTSSYGWFGGNNTLYQGATTSSDRKVLTLLDNDIHRNVSEYGRRVLMTVGRWLYANCPAVQAVIDEQASMATEGMQVQFYGEDREWGDAAENALIEWGRICNVSGWPYDFNEYLRLLVISMIRDGDVGTVLVENSDGYPLLQTIGAHRVVTTAINAAIATGEYSGRWIVDGTIIDELRRPLAYRVVDDAGQQLGLVPARDMFMTFRPATVDQIRGISELASSVFELQDMQESRTFELIAQKAASAWALIEENESGTADTAKSVIKSAATRDDTSKQKTASAIEKLEGGAIRYFKAGSNSKLHSFNYDRPGSNVMSYQETALRDVFASLGWSHYFTLDPSKVGGASMRVIVERINRSVRARQRIVAKAARRIHGWVISKFMHLGLLPWNDDWWKWEYQFPSEITADRKYDSDVDVQEVNARFSTLKRACAKRGEYWEDVQDQWLMEQKRLQDRAKEIGVDLSRAAVAPAETTPNRTRREPVNEPGAEEAE